MQGHVLLPSSYQYHSQPTSGSKGALTAQFGPVPRESFANLFIAQRGFQAGTFPPDRFPGQTSYKGNKPGYSLFVFILCYGVYRFIGACFIVVVLLLWPPIVTGRPLYFCPVISFYLSSFFPPLISAIGDWMSTILPHMVWP